MMSTKDLRILKLHLRGLRPEQIARKIGIPHDVKRVIDGLERMNVEPHRKISP